MQDVPVDESRSSSMRSLMADGEEARQIRQRAGEFTLLLLKAITQTGTYSSEHVLARSAVDEMFALFRQLTQQAHELTYTLVSTMDEKGVVLDGLLDQPIEVAKTFRGVLGDHFVGKFHDYFVRNRIAAFTLKRELTREELEAFLEGWTRWSLQASREVREAGAPESLVELLGSMGLVHCTVVGMDEVLGGIRHLPWPVKIALSRLRKDISRLPMLREASPDTIRELKAQAIREVIRPIHRIETLRDILLNADLVSEGLHVAIDLPVENVLVAAMKPRQLMEVAGQMLNYIDELRKPAPRLNLAGRDPRAFQQSLLELTRKALRQLGSSDLLQEARPLLMTAYQAEILGFADLPPSVQSHIKAGMMTDRFLEKSREYLEDFDRCGDPKAYLKYLNVLVIVIPELLARKEKDLLVSLFGVITRHAAEPVPPFLGRNRFLTEALGHLDKGSFLDDLIRLTVSLPKETRGPLEDGLALFGPNAVLPVIRHLSVSEDPGCRRALCSVLVKIGKPALDHVLDELKAHRHNWYTIRNLVEVVGQIGDSRATPILVRYLEHPHAKVREACVTALARLASYDAEKDLLGRMNDPDETVVRRAVEALGAIHSTHPLFLERLRENIRSRTHSEDEPADLLQIASLRALMEYERIVLPDDPDFEALLLEALRPPKWRTVLPGRLGVRRKSPEVVQVMLETLGVIGRSRTLDALGSADFNENLPPALQAVAAAARQRIERRLSGADAPSGPATG